MKTNMATPYLQIFTGEVTSTQDLAREHVDELPVVVVAPSQTRGRGRSGASWSNADRALAVSVAWRPDRDDHRPFSLMAGLASVAAIPADVRLKWPNDVMLGEKKVGGILVERSDEVAVAGLGLNLHWPDPPHGAGAIHESDPGPERHRAIGALWAAGFLALLAELGWPLQAYREICSTLGRKITWEPNGSGIAAGVTETGALLVDTSAGVEEIHAGEVRHLSG